MKLYLYLLLPTLLGFLNPFFDKSYTPQPPPLYNILQYGAVGDGKTINTKAIQKAIDEATKSGGGRVVVPEGDFATGSFYLKSNVEFYLSKGARILGSPEFNDYLQLGKWWALILAKDADHVTISGPGTVDGQGIKVINDIKKKISEGILDKKWTDGPRPGEVRPYMIELVGCKNLTVKDITLTNGACWTQDYIECENMVVSNVKVRSFSYWHTDGIDLTDCKNVKVTGMDIQCEDDGICLKSYNPKSMCENITIDDCKVSSGSSAFKLGTASYGGFRNIHASNLEIYDTFRSAIALEIVDGGVMDHILIENVKAKNTLGTIFIRLGQRNVKVPPGTIDGIVLRNVSIESPPDRKNRYQISFDNPPSKGGPRSPHNANPSAIVGIPGHYPKNILLENVHVQYFGGGNKKTAYIPDDSISRVPEKERSYPETGMFGELPASAFYLRHSENISFQNVSLDYRNADERHSLVADDVKKIEVKDLHIANSPNLLAILLKDVKEESIATSASLSKDQIKKIQ